MKRLLSLLAVALLAIGVQAQTPIPLPESVATPSPDSKLAKVGSSLWNFVKDAEPFYGTNQTIRLSVGGLECGGEWGTVAAVSVMVDSQLSIGFATAYLDNMVYTASLSVQTGTTWDVPLIGKVYTYVESGPGYNLDTDEPIAQSFVGAVWKHDFNSEWHLYVGGAIGNISDREAAVRAFGVGLQHGF